MHGVHRSIVCQLICCIAEIADVLFLTNLLPCNLQKQLTSQGIAKIGPFTNIECDRCKPLLESNQRRVHKGC
jgi:hypothetical protein